MANICLLSQPSMLVHKKKQNQKQQVALLVSILWELKFDISTAHTIPWVETQSKTKIHVTAEMIGLSMIGFSFIENETQNGVSLNNI